MAPVEQLVLKQQIHTAMLEVFKQKILRDADGDWPIQSGHQYAYVRLEMAPEPHALVFARAAAGTSQDSIAEVHDLNASAAWAKFVRTDSGDVFVYQRVPRSSITAIELRSAIESVMTCAREAGPMLQAVYGTSPDASDAR